MKEFADKNDKKLNTARRVLAVLIILTLVFIWGHSFMNREDSSNESDWVRKLVTPILEFFVGSGNVTEHLVRKLAHFCEYALLGAELFCFFSANSAVIPESPAGSGLRSSRFRLVLLSEAHVMFTSTTDETIQIFSGRGSQLQDVWLDNAGGLAGIVFALVVIAVFFVRRLSVKTEVKNK